MQWRVNAVVVGVVVVLVVCAAGPAVAKWAYTWIVEAEVPLTGQKIVVPLPQDAGPGEIKIALSGTFHCAYNGRTYDPFRATSDSGEFELRHNYVRWSPDQLGDPTLVDRGDAGSAYVLFFPFEATELPESVSAWIDIDQFVTDLIITPSEVRESLSGSLRVEVWRRPSGPCTPFYYEGIAALVLIGVAILGIGAMIAVRRRPRVKMSDVGLLLSRIDQKYESAVGTVRSQREDQEELTVELERLRDGSRELAKHIEAFRKAALTVDRGELDGEIAGIEGQLEGAEREDVRREIEATLATKRKLRDLLADSDASEKRYLLRLAKIESTMDTITLRVTGQEQRLADEVHEDRAIAELEEELKALDEAIEELRVVG